MILGISLQGTFLELIFEIVFALGYFHFVSKEQQSLWKQTYPRPINKSIHYFYPFFR